MRGQYLPFLLLLAACLALLPIVHPLVAEARVDPPVVIGLGLLSMGLAWAGGCSLQARRRRTVYAIAVAGVALPLLAWTPMLAPAFEGWPRALALTGSVLSALGLFALRPVYARA